ncbi:BRCT domain-containing protein [Neofusicoccum parvum]|uniref:BRCT domain-containing protein n=1 Tax=Neofusicoccum parvum TaxID=310453 RepID=A0ACB5SHN9_9PEZI|nr:BRCT domain-containing protein [Neofusicoccum parvum]
MGIFSQAPKPSTASGRDDITTEKSVDDLDSMKPSLQAEAKNSLPIYSGEIHPESTLAPFNAPPTTSEAPPDGGLKAWLQVFAGHLTLICIWGYINSFGLFQAYYESEYNLPPSTISWIVSVQIFILNLFSSVSGRLFDAGYFRSTVITGMFLEVLAIFMTSISTKYWQIFLSQGLCGGIGISLVWCPTVSLVSTYFVKRRAVAISFVLCGSSLGGVIFPAVFQQLMPRIGFRWTVRVIGFIIMGLYAVVLSLTRTRTAPRASGPFLDLKSFKEPSYSLFTVGTFAMIWGVYNAFFYVNSFARDIAGIDTSQSSTLLYLMNGGAIAGRLIPSFVADRFFGSLNTYVFLTAIAGIIMFCWSVVDSWISLMIWAAFYGFFGSGVQGIFTAALAGLTTDLQKMGIRIVSSKHPQHPFSRHHDMRLLNTSTLEFEAFNPSAIPPYAILSHRWQADEVLFEDMTTGLARNKKGYGKIVDSCKQAAKDRFGYIWVDTCCIDKQSSAELSEAINSMYAWYSEADICYAYLADATDGVDPEVDTEFAESEWFDRGWTLQELVAPAHVVFFSSGWVRLGDKASLCEVLSEITWIDGGVLAGAVGPRTLSVAQRMSWAAKRMTTRPEDVAYCLMGLFDINMPMLYGEGEKAFIRLQEEIMRASDDESLFAWVDRDADPDALYGLLAKSPAWFAEARGIERSDERFALGPRHLFLRYGREQYARIKANTLLSYHEATEEKDRIQSMLVRKISGSSPNTVKSNRINLDHECKWMSTMLTVHGAQITYHVAEAKLVIGKVATKRRAVMELRSRSLYTDDVTPSSDATGPPTKKRKTGHLAKNPEGPEVVEIPDESTAEREGDAAAGAMFLADGLQGNTVKVIRMEWLDDSSNAGKLLPLRNYLVYEGRPVPESSSPTAPTLSRQTQPPSIHKLSSVPASKFATGQSILERAKADTYPNTASSQGTSHSTPVNKGVRLSGSRTGQSSSSSKLALLQQTTSDYEDEPSSDIPPPPDWVAQGIKYACQRSTPANPPNAAFIAQLKSIRLTRTLTGDEVGVRAYSTAIAALAAYPYALTHAKEILRLPGCDAKIANLWIEWKNSPTGTITAVASAETDEDLQILRLFHNIWGVGAATAREFLYDRNWRTLDDIVAHGWATLSRVQQIGVKHYDELLAGIPRAEASRIAATVRRHAALVRDGRVEVAVAGGCRRGKEAAGDVDLVVSHRDLAATDGLVVDLVQSLEREGWVTHTLLLSLRNSARGQAVLPFRGGAGGGTGFDSLDKALVVWRDPAWSGGGERNPNVHRRVDIIVSPWRTVGCAVVGWTGGTTFQRDLRRYAKNVKGWKFDSSGVRDRRTGEVVLLEGEEGVGEGLGWEDAEKKVFEGLGLEWIRPEERCTG